MFSFERMKAPEEGLSGNGIYLSTALLIPHPIGLFPYPAITAANSITSMRFLGDPEHSRRIFPVDAAPIHYNRA